MTATNRHHTQSFADFTTPHGADLIARTQPFYDYYEARREESSWFYARRIDQAPDRAGSIQTADGLAVEGLNFGSQDYLSFASHPVIHEAAERALRDFGPHSAGSPCAMGNTPISQGLERSLAELLQMPEVLLFPTGWAAGYGSVAGLVRPNDHIVMDRLAHNCLQLGAFASTRNVRRYSHNDTGSLRAALQEIRSNDVENGILVITEGLYSMDSDVPDLVAMQDLCHEYGATLLVDVAHDLGSSGPGGTGSIGLQGLLSKVDLVMGSFSKTFASNGGFLAARHPSVTQYVRYYGASHMFSNALSPMQTAVIREAIRVVRSPEGDARRAQLLGSVNALRDALTDEGIECLGTPSAIVPALIGEERIARAMHEKLNRRQLITQFVEFPVVERGRARIRMQVMANHTPQDARSAAAVIGQVRDEVLELREAA